MAILPSSSRGAVAAGTHHAETRILAGTRGPVGQFVQLAHFGKAMASLRLQLGGKLLSELHNFWSHHCCTVTLEGIARKIFLMVRLSFVPLSCRNDLSDDPVRINPFLGQFRNHGFCNTFLLR